MKQTKKEKLFQQERGTNAIAMGIGQNMILLYQMRCYHNVKNSMFDVCNADYDNTSKML